MVNFSYFMRTERAWGGSGRVTNSGCPHDLAMLITNSLGKHRLNYSRSTKSRRITQHKNYLMVVISAFFGRHLSQKLLRVWGEGRGTNGTRDVLLGWRVLSPSHGCQEPHVLREAGDKPLSLAGLSSVVSVFWHRAFLTWCMEIL